MMFRTDGSDGGPAFAHGDPTNGGDPGMSLRDWFATHERLEVDTVTPELAAVLMGEPGPTGAMPILRRAMWWAEAEARYKYLRADAMLKVRAE
jgi:hypothetical protein